jgi:hypothetical protein
VGFALFHISSNGLFVDLFFIGDFCGGVFSIEVGVVVDVVVAPPTLVSFIVDDDCLFCWG